jgi:hypothetical protein
VVAVNEDFLADGQPQVLATHDFMNMDSVTAYFLGAGAYIRLGDEERRLMHLVPRPKRE